MERRLAPHSATAASRPSRQVWLLVIPWDPKAVGGVSQVVLNLAAALRASGKYELAILVPDWSQPQPRAELRDGNRLLHMRLMTSSGPRGSARSRLTHAARLPLQRRRLIRLLKELNVAVVNLHFPAFFAEALVSDPAIRAAVPFQVVCSVHGLDVMGLESESAVWRARFDRLVGQADHVVAVAGRLAQETRRLLPSVADRVSVVHNGIDPQQLSQAGEPPCALPRRYILNLGTFEHKKGHTYLVDAFARLARDFPDLGLVIAGRTSDRLEPLRAQIAEAGLAERVTLLTDLPHPAACALLRGATLFCLSSLAEGLPLVVLEAGFFHVPVVATAVDGVPEAIRDGEDGLLVPSQDAGALAVALRTLLEAPERGARMAASLHQRVLSHFTWQRAAQEYLSLADGKAVAAE